MRSSLESLTILGKRKLIGGKVFPRVRRFEAFIERLRSRPGGAYDPDKVPGKVLSQACEMVIDDRLARAGKYELGDVVEFLFSA